MFVLRAHGLAIAAFAALGTSVLAQDHTSEHSEAQITDPNAECTPYSYAPTASSAHNFPPIWQPAKLFASDAEGQALCAKIKGSISNIPPKVQPNGSTIGVTYDSVNDPDCWWTAKRCTTPKLAGLPQDVSSVPEPRTIGYGFDDGPNCTNNVFYDFLTSQNQKATMFFIGSNVFDWPLEAKRALVDGHQICIRRVTDTWSHGYMTAFASEDAFAELWYTAQAIKLVTGVTPTCWRPPHGDVDDRIRAIANGMGLQTILWHYDSNDWRILEPNYTTADVGASYKQFIRNLTAGTFDTVGGIILMHELSNFTMQEAINWYPQFKAAFVPVGVALNTTNPYLEKNYSLPTFEQYISDRVTVSNNNSSSATSNTTTSSSSTSSGSSPGSGSGKIKSSASGVTVPCGTWWALLLSSAMLLSSGPVL